MGSVRESNPRRRTKIGTRPQILRRTKVCARIAVRRCPIGNTGRKVDDHDREKQGAEVEACSATARADCTERAQS